MTDYHWIAIKRGALALVSLSLVAVVACGGAPCGPSRR